MSIYYESSGYYNIGSIAAQIRELSSVMEKEGGGVERVKIVGRKMRREEKEAVLIAIKPCTGGDAHHWIESGLLWKCANCGAWKFIPKSLVGAIEYSKELRGSSREDAYVEMLEAGDVDIDELVEKNEEAKRRWAGRDNLGGTE